MIAFFFIFAIGQIYSFEIKFQHKTVSYLIELSAQKIEFSSKGNRYLIENKKCNRIAFEEFKRRFQRNLSRFSRNQTDYRVYIKDKTFYLDSKSRQGHFFLFLPITSKNLYRKTSILCHKEFSTI